MTPDIYGQIEGPRVYCGTDRFMMLSDYEDPMEGLDILIGGIEDRIEVGEYELAGQRQ